MGHPHPTLLLIPSQVPALTLLSFLGILGLHRKAQEPLIFPDAFISDEETEAHGGRAECRCHSWSAAEPEMLFPFPPLHPPTLPFTPGPGFHPPACLWL